MVALLHFLLLWFSIPSRQENKLVLEPFLAKLGVSGEQVRIAWFGDSGVEADLITQTIRDSLQKWYGGRGVGFVPILSRAPGYRRSVGHRFSGNWNWESLEPAATYRRNLGIAGHGFYTYRYPAQPDEAPWVQFTGSSLSPRTDSFPTLRLFYGRNPTGSTRASVAFRTEQITGTATLLDTALLNEVVLHNQAVRQVRIQAFLPPDLPLYGLSMESPDGLILDNFSLRGLDGPRLTRIPLSMLAAFHQNLGYDLLVFQFGLNVLGPTQTDYRWYELRLMRLIQHFQQAFPGIPILIVGPPDKCNGPAGTKVSNPGLPYLTSAMASAAKKGNAAFFSLAEAMGGPGSMKRWVEKERPPLAASDYTHFTFAGAERAAQLILPLFQKPQGTQVTF